MVSEYINIITTIFDLYQAFTQHGYTKNRNKEKPSIKKASI